MPNSKSPVLRVLVPVVLIALGLVITWSVARNAAPSNRPSGPAPVVTPAPTTPGATTPAGEIPAAGGEAATPPGVEPAAPAVQEQPAATPAAPLVGLRARPVEGEMTSESLSALGSLDPGAAKMEITFTPVGAGIESIKLSEHFQTVDRREHDVVQAAIRSELVNASGAVTKVLAPPMAALFVEIDGSMVNLGGARERIWEEVGPGHFRATIEDAEGNAVARVVRRFVLGPTDYFVRLEQHVENLSGRPLKVRWYQYGPASMARGVPGYGGETRRARMGYLRSPASDPAQQHVQAVRFLMPHSELVGRAIDESRGLYADKVLWPNARSQSESLSLVFAAMTNRYFAAAIFPLVDTQAATPDKRLLAAAQIDRWVVATGPDPSGGRPELPVVLRVVGPETELGAGQRADLSMGLYAGPLSERYTDASEQTRRVGLGELVVYTFGGPCAFCTFQSLTHGLLAFLRMLHSYIVFDWALAIIVLVFVVRLVLHPVTKFSQTSMYRFGKQMQGLAPKQKKIQEKYKDDPKKMREELARVMREENINYAGALGCLPMFLQMPIWIALFAMLFFAFDLRHEGAFFGVFQAITGGSWHFLADLAEPDRFMMFPGGFSLWIPWISDMMGPIASLNILPLLLGVVFYIQQKYMTPPTTMTMTPEQEAQQKMIKVMMVIMFPLFMYNAPSGLAIYFITNSALAIIESRHIRAHAERVDAERAKQPRQPRKTSGFFARIQEQIEARRKMMEQMQSQQSRNKGGGGGAGKKENRGPGRGGRPDKR